MNKKKTPFWYWLLYSHVRLGNRLYLRKFIVRGKDNLDFTRPQIFTGNHANGFIDPLVVMFSARTAASWLTRADIFKNPKTASFLHGLKMVPVYRARDGKQSMINNDRTFDAAVESINAMVPLGIFPEGSQVIVRTLRSLKSGVARIALRKDVNPEVIIVPFGLYFSEYSKGYTDCIVNIGQPIVVKDYHHLSFPDNKTALVKDLHKKISELMIHLPEKGYDTYEKALNITVDHQYDLDDTLATFDQQRVIAQKFHQCDASTYDNIHKLVTDFSDLKKKVGYRDHQKVFQSKSIAFWIKEFLIFILLSPAIALGWLINFLPYRYAHHKASNAKQKHMYGTLMEGLYLVLFPFWYLSIGVMLSIFSGSWWCLLIVILFGIISLRLVRRLQNDIDLLSSAIKKRKHPSEYEKLEHIAHRIFNTIHS